MLTRYTRSSRLRWAPLVVVASLPALLSVACQHSAPRTMTIFGDRAPARAVSDPDTQPVELGVRFRSSQPGWITGVRFFKTEGNTGNHTGTLWSNNGARLATGTFSDESDHGWQELTFPSPVKIEPNAHYVASYHTETGRYVSDPGGLAAPATNGPLTAPAHGSAGANSVYSYGRGSVFPTSNWRAANYWVDVRFATDGAAPAPTAAPATTGSTRAPAAPPSSRAPTPTTPGAVQPGGGVVLRPVDGGPTYFARWSNSLPTDPSFFPIAVFNETLDNPADTAARYRALGINGFVGVWHGMSPQIASALKANGQWAFTAPEPDGAPGYGREWAGYEWFDEPDGYNVCGYVVAHLATKCSGNDRTYPSAVQAMADAVRAIDGSRPTFGQFTKPVALGSGLDLPTRKAYVNAVDVVSYDFYPISDPWESPPANLWQQADAVKQVRDLTGRTKPVWVFIETSKLWGDNPKGRVTPTNAQIQAQVWHAIIGGARGIEYFNHNFSGDPTYTQHLLIDPTYASVAAAVSQTNAQIKALAPVINAPFAENVLTVTGGQVNSMVKFHDGSYYLFVGSRSKSAQNVTMKVNGIGNATATVVNENRTVNITDGTLTDNFAGETAVHIYKIG